MSGYCDVAALYSLSNLEQPKKTEAEEEARNKRGKTQRHGEEMAFNRKFRLRRFFAWSVTKVPLEQKHYTRKQKKV